MRQPCTFPDCQSPAVVNSLCVKHKLLSAREMRPVTTMEWTLGRPMTEEERLRLQEARDLGAPLQSAK